MPFNNAHNSIFEALKCMGHMKKNIMMEFQKLFLLMDDILIVLTKKKKLEKTIIFQ